MFFFFYSDSRHTPRPWLFSRISFNSRKQKKKMKQRSGHIIIAHIFVARVAVITTATATAASVAAVMKCREKFWEKKTFKSISIYLFFQKLKLDPSPPFPFGRRTINGFSGFRWKINLRFRTITDHFNGNYCKIVEIPIRIRCVSSIMSSDNFVKLLQRRRR